MDEQELALQQIVESRLANELETVNSRFSSPVIRLVDNATWSQKLETLLLLHFINSQAREREFLASMK